MNIQERLVNAIERQTIALEEIKDLLIKANSPARIVPPIKHYSDEEIKELLENFNNTPFTIVNNKKALNIRQTKISIGSGKTVVDVNEHSTSSGEIKGYSVNTIFPDIEVIETDENTFKFTTHVRIERSGHYYLVFTTCTYNIETMDQHIKCMNIFNNDCMIIYHSFIVDGTPHKHDIVLYDINQESEEIRLLKQIKR